MAGIFKRFVNVAADKYIFPDAEDLTVSDGAKEDTGRLDLPNFDEEADEAPAVKSPEGGEPVQEPEPEPEPKEPSPIDFAKIQADAILADAEKEAQALRDKAMEEVQAELAQLREVAREDGYNMSFAQGIAEGRMEAKKQLDEMAESQVKEVQAFLKEAARQRDRLLDDSKQDLKELALAIAEKVITVSLKSSGNVILKMVESATAKRRRCEWVQVYIADCDARASAETVPELTAALSRLSDRVRVIPMADDESGTCIIEMPDEIIDASVSTQLDALRGIVTNSDTDRAGWPV